MIEHGNYRVMRRCCTSGNCFTCFGEWNLKRRKWVMQLDRLSEDTAKQVAENWKRYDAKVEEM